MEAITLLLCGINKTPVGGPFHNRLIFPFPVTHLQEPAQQLGCPRLLGKLQLSSSLE